MPPYVTLNPQLKFRPEKFGGILYDKSSRRWYLVRDKELSLFLTLLNNFSIPEKIIEFSNHKALLQRLVIPSSSSNVNIDSAFDQTYKLIEKREKTSWFLYSPLEINIYPTLDCPAHCVFCYLGNIKSNLKRFKFNTEIANVICCEISPFSIGILGGEPTLLIDKCEEFIAKLCSLDPRLEISISTLGCLYSLEIIETLKKLIKSYNVSIELSLHSLNYKIWQKLTGLSLKFFNNVQKMLKELSSDFLLRQKTYIKFVVTKLNYHTIYYDIKLLYNMGFENFALINYICKIGEDLKSYKRLSVNPIEILKLEANLKEHFSKIDINVFGVLNPSKRFKDGLIEKYMIKCSGGTISLEILGNGDVYPCSLSLLTKEYYLGNLLKNNWELIWDSEKLKIFREGVYSTLPPCINCKNTKVCGGKCFLESIYLFGNPQIPSPECPKAYKMYIE